MPQDSKPYRIILSGGGTGGHIFPAIAIANEFKSRYANADILFVGAIGKMEMTRVPESGYKIIGLSIAGLQRNLSFSNLLLPFKIIGSYYKAKAIVKSFNPHAVVGTGGYASSPILLAATRKKIPSLIQEQNSYAGITNKQLAARANKICVAYTGMEKYFPQEKIVFTGNPVRKDISSAPMGEATLISPIGNQEIGLRFFGLESGKKTVLVLGGSLGARTINESVFLAIDKWVDAGLQVIWQTGKIYLDEFKQRTASMDMRKVKLYDFLNEMNMAYAAADVVVSRAGALAISELCLVAKPSIFVPSPNVAEDHQTKNAMALVNVQAAGMIADKESKENLSDEVLKLIYDDRRCKVYSENMRNLAKPNATRDIVNEIEKLIGGR
jgi:UDP-N-acetylglucosamine--N-acetylmuramyl-(pentapeptide) pyrophosphoryl-undecaprenol N-acetylglucosamine transferase